MVILRSGGIIHEGEVGQDKGHVIMETEFNLHKVEDSAEKLRPEDFLIASGKISGKSLILLKELYDLTKSAENEATSSSSLRKSLPTLAPPSTRSPSGSRGHKKSQNKKKDLFSRTEIPLPTLITQDFDQDQIWEEIQLQNGLIYDSLVSSISKVLAHKPRAKVESEESEDDEAILKDLNSTSGAHLDDEDDEEDELSDFFESDEKYRRKKAKEQVKYSRSIVDDKFFNLAQMTEFVDKMDAAEAAKMDDDDDKEETEESEEEDDDNVDYFKADDNDDGEDDPEVEYYYKDFFDPPLDEGKNKKNSSASEKDGSKRSVRFNLEEDEVGGNEQEEEEGQRLLLDKSQEDDSPDEEDVDPATLSTFEKKKKRIEENIKAMEEQALQPKSWQLTGEVTAQTRPENSLLEEHLLYDHLLRQAPEITTKTTQKLEDIIKQRVKDQSWDDVLRKIKPIENVSEYKKRLVLDAEKSKMSLTEIYEKEYVEKQETVVNETEEDKDPEEHKAIQKDMKTLFAKLDALSHFNYTPKAPVPEIKTITNASATSMEEITPSTFSEAMLLAPQEILEPAKGEVKGKAERSSTDKKRERRLKKKKQHLKRLSQEEKARSKGLGLRNIKLAESVVKKSKKGSTDEIQQNNKELKSSKAFFAKLQEQVHTHIDRVAKKNKASLDAKVISAKRYKL